MTNFPEKKLLPDISDLVGKIRGLEGEILRLELERKDLSKKRKEAAQEIYQRYKKANVLPEQCNHPEEIRDYNALDSSIRCGYCETKLD